MNRLHSQQLLTSRRHLLVGLALMLLTAVAAQWALRPGPSPAPVGRFQVVEGTTLVALQGDVRYQPPTAAAFRPVAGAQSIQAGDRVRTGTDGYAWLLFADGSATSLSPETELELRHIDDDAAAGIQAVSIEQLRGSTWTRSASPSSPSRPTLVVSGSDQRSVSGSQFTTQLEPDGAMVVTSVNGIVEAWSSADRVDVPGGFITRLVPGRTPTVPVPAPAPAVTLDFRVQGLVTPLLTDARGRSVGYHPAAEPYVSQIPGAILARGERGAQVISVPSPVESYTLMLRGRAAERVVVSIAITRGDSPQAVEAARQQATIGPDQTLSSVFEWRDGAIRERQALANVAGPPAASAIVVLARPPAPAAGRPAAGGPALAPPEPDAPADAAGTAVPALASEAAPEPLQASDDGQDASTSAQTSAIALAPAPAASAVAPSVAQDQRAAPPPPAVTESGSASVQVEPTDVPLTVGIVLVPATVPPTLAPQPPEPATHVPTTPIPPTAAPTVPPPLPTPTMTAVPTRVPTLVRTTAPGVRPAIAPTATPYRAPITPSSPRLITPTRCPYPSC